MEKLFNLIEENKKHLSSQLYKDMIEAFAELRTQVNTNKHWYRIRFNTFVREMVLDEDSPKYKFTRLMREQLAYTLEPLSTDDLGKGILIHDHRTCEIGMLEFAEDHVNVYNDNGDLIELGPTDTLTWFDKVDI